VVKGGDKDGEGSDTKSSKTRGIIFKLYAADHSIVVFAYRIIYHYQQSPKVTSGSTQKLATK
jgi:hypothetical protein